MRYFVFTLSLSISFLYFSVLSIYGKTHTSDTNNPIYQYIVIATSISALLIALFHILINRKLLLSRVSMISLLIPVFLSLIFIFESPRNPEGFRFYSFYLTFSLPATYIAIFLAKSKSIRFFVKFWDIVILIINIGLIVSLPKIIFLSNINVGGAGYQSISYMAAFAYSISLYFLLFGNNHARLKFFKSNIYVVFTFLFLSLNIVSIFLSGGRGGFVVAFVSTFSLLYLKLKHRSMLKNIIAIFIFVPVLFIASKSLLPNEASAALKDGYNRVFSYFSSSGIDISETSGRDIVYKNVFDLINARPILGYGIFKYTDYHYSYPHNIFFEFLIQGGIFYFIFWISIFITFIRKFRRIIKLDEINIFIVPFICFSFTQLLFSSSYLISGLFWFTIVYVINYDEPYVASLKPVNN